MNRWSTRLLALLAVAGTLAAVGPGRLSRLPSACLWRRVLDRPCPGCGLTRGFAHLARLDPVGATRSNRLTIPVAAVLGLWWLRPSRRRRPLEGPPPGESAL